MKTSKQFFFALLSFFLFVGIANGVQLQRKILATTSISSSTNGGTYTGSIVKADACTAMFMTIKAKSSNNAANYVVPYMDVLTQSTAAAGDVIRSAGLGGFIADNNTYTRAVTGFTGVNTPTAFWPWVRPVFTYSKGFTGTVEVWCTATDDSR